MYYAAITIMFFGFKAKRLIFPFERGADTVMRDFILCSRNHPSLSHFLLEKLTIYTVFFIIPGALIQPENQC